MIPDEELRRIPKELSSLRLRNAKKVRCVFADTLYWLAIFVSGDACTAARAADCSDALLVTTEEVLSEFLTAVSAHGDHTRRLACRLVREILLDPGIEVVAQSHAIRNRALQTAFP